MPVDDRDGPADDGRRGGVGKGGNDQIIVAGGPPLSGSTDGSGPTTGTHDRGRVLVVEDHVDMLGMCRQVLADDGYEAVTAASAEAALELADDLGDLRLLVTDLDLPGMDGLRLASVLAERSTRMGVLLLSGHDLAVVLPRLGFIVDNEVEEEHVPDAVADGGPTNVAFLAKPFTPGQLVAAAAGTLADARGGDGGQPAAKGGGTYAGTYVFTPVPTATGPGAGGGDDVPGAVATDRGDMLAWFKITPATAPGGHAASPSAPPGVGGSHGGLGRAAVAVGGSHGGLGRTAVAGVGVGAHTHGDHTLEIPRTYPASGGPGGEEARPGAAEKADTKRGALVGFGSFPSAKRLTIVGAAAGVLLLTAGVVLAVGGGSDGDRPLDAALPGVAGSERDGGDDVSGADAAGPASGEDDTGPDRGDDHGDGLAVTDRPVDPASEPIVGPASEAAADSSTGTEADPTAAPDSATDPDPTSTRDPTPEPDSTPDPAADPEPAVVAYARPTMGAPALASCTATSDADGTTEYAVAFTVVGAGGSYDVLAGEPFVGNDHRLEIRGGELTWTVKVVHVRKSGDTSDQFSVDAPSAFGWADPGDDTRRYTHDPSQLTVHHDECD